MKLTVIGGGSTYTPELADGIARLRDYLDIEELALVDPDERRLQLVGGMTQRILRHHDHPAKVITTDDLDEGTDGAGAVLIQLRVGGQAARARDEAWPLECSCVGQETTGAGGLAKALRTVPVVLDVAERASRRMADGAWIVDFTNPVGIVTRALLDAGHHAVGLCNVAIGFQRHFADLLGVAPERLTLDHAGLNHLTWERAAFLDGEDVLPGLLAEHGDALAQRVELPASYLRATGTVPSYYLRYFYAHDEVVEEQRHEPSRAATVSDIEQQLLAIYADERVDTKPELLTKRGGAYYSEAAVQLLAGLVRDAGDVQVVDIRNNGALPFLPDEAVVELSCRVGAGGATPVPLSRPLEPGMAGLIAHVAAYEELAVDAALRGGRQRVEAALLAHPLVGQIDLARELTDRLLAANTAYLPWARA